MIRFKDRADAGRKLVSKLLQYKNKPSAVVIGLPRGGVVTAFEVAKELNLPLDIIVSRKIASPAQPELALGALSQEGFTFFDEKIMRMMAVTKEELAPIVHAEKQEAKRRLKLYRGDLPPLDLENKVAILVDDGIATGATMMATILSARNLKAQKIIIAVPVSPPETLQKIKKEVDEVICLGTPSVFRGVGAFYDSFAQTDDNEVISLMKRSKRLQ